MSPGGETEQLCSELLLFIIIIYFACDRSSLSTWTLCWGTWGLLLSRSTGSEALAQ